MFEDVLGLIAIAALSVSIIYRLYIILFKKSPLGDTRIRIKRAKSEIYYTIILTVLWVGGAGYYLLFWYREMNSLIDGGWKESHSYILYLLICFLVLHKVVGQYMGLSSRNLIFDWGIYYKYKMFLWEDIKSYSWIHNTIKLSTNKRYPNNDIYIEVMKNQKDEIEKLLIELYGDPVERSSAKRDEA